MNFLLGMRWFFALVLHFFYLEEQNDSRCKKTGTNELMNGGEPD